MDDRLPARQSVSRAVRLLAQPRTSATDTGLVTAVALRLAALDSEGDAAERLVAASDRVVAGVAGVMGDGPPSREWSETAQALALLLADRGITRRHLVAARKTLGSADKLVDLMDRLHESMQSPIDIDDLGRALAVAVAGPAELLEAMTDDRNGERGRRGRRAMTSPSTGEPARPSVTRGLDGAAIPLP